MTWCFDDGPAATPADSSPAKAAAVAAKVCLNQGETARAAAVLGPGLRAVPGSFELLFLGRILEREKNGRVSTGKQIANPKN